MVNPSTPVFFLSYARSKRSVRPVSGPMDVNHQVRRLFRDLSTHVTELVGLPAGQDPGFMDVSMDGGEVWQAQLLAAVGHCQVFVCLLSTPYVTRSEWCAMEWDAFTRRRVVRRSGRTSGRESAILPVLWAPVERELPPAVARVASFAPTGLPDPTIVATYSANGLYGLLSMGADDAYKAVVWKLALQIQQTYSDCFVEPRTFRGTTLQRSFARPEARRTVGARGAYFFLSHARTPPVLLEESMPSESMPEPTVDPFVDRFYRDLQAEVTALAAADSPLDPGFFDGLLPAGADLRAQTSEALGRAEVFVPLYSPGYLNRAWSLAEREAFRQRLATSGAVGPARRVVPVLWVPLPPWNHGSDLQAALELGHDVPGYVELGLRALCRLASYEAQYQTVLRRLARRIVDLAESEPVGASPAPSLSEVEPAGRPDASFVVGVLARKGTRWRPFAGSSKVPIAEYAANVAERLGLPTRIVAADDVELFSECPGVALIDPGIAADASGEARLARFGEALRTWTPVLVVADSGDPGSHERAAGLTVRAAAALKDAGAIRVAVAEAIEEVARLLPALITEARRHYLRNAPVFAPGGRRARPRLGARDSDRSDAP